MNYHPFGHCARAPVSAMTIKGSSYQVDSCRFDYNGMEQDDEVSGSRNSYDYGFRIYNPIITKFLSVDPLASSFPYYTPYQFAGNKPIVAIDIDGLEEWIAIFNTNGDISSFEYDETLTPLGENAIYMKVEGSTEECLGVYYINQSESKTSRSVVFLPNDDAIKSEAKHGELAYAADATYFANKGALSENMAAIQGDNTEDMAFSMATYAIENHVNFSDVIIDFHGTQHFEKRQDGKLHKLDIGSDKLTVNESGNPMNYSEYQKYFQLMSKFMTDNSTTLLGACNADKCSNLVSKMSEDLNTTIYGHKSYSYSDNLYNGRFYGGGLARLQAQLDGNVENQGLYIKSNPEGVVSDVQGVKFDVSAEKAGEISEVKK